MDGRHQAADDAELVVDHLGERARQLVVHEALEMMFWLPSYLSSLTPITMVMSSSLAGAEMMTFLTPGFEVAAAPWRVVEDAGGLDDDVDAQRRPTGWRRARP